jgi:hypothetical protein
MLLQLRCSLQASRVACQTHHGVRQISLGIDNDRPLVAVNLRVSIFRRVSELCMPVPRISVSIQ